MDRLTKEDVREVITKVMEPMLEQVESLHAGYFGNGSTGLKTKVAVLETRTVIIYLLLAGIVVKLLASHFA